MSDWSNNNLAHVHTWLCMFVLHELPAESTFDISGEKMMSELAFWSHLDSIVQRNIKANSLASQMDNIFRLFQGAQYENNVTKASAVESLSAALTNASNTLKTLAAKSDECYRFKNEMTGI